MKMFIVKQAFKESLLKNDPVSGQIVSSSPKGHRVAVEAQTLCMTPDP